MCKLLSGKTGKSGKVEERVWDHLNRLKGIESSAAKVNTYIFSSEENTSSRTELSKHIMATIGICH